MEKDPRCTYFGRPTVLDLLAERMSLCFEI
jgi:hypothetical protein